MDNSNLKWDKRFLQIALLICNWSKDTSTKVGCVITTAEGEIISTGYNGMCRNIDDKNEFRNQRPQKYMWFEHAERNAIFNAAKRGIKLDGCTLYVTSIPVKFSVCADCARAVIQSGIKKVVQISFDEIIAEKWVESGQVTADMFKEAGVDFYTTDI
jgi:dCMP deaminase